MGNNKLVIFDFCDTLINFQTGNRFLYWVYQTYYNKKNNESLIVRFFKRYPFSIFFDYKRYLARQIKWIPIKFINERIKDFIKILNDNQNEKVVDIMKQYLEEWNQVIIISAWFGDYIRIRAKQFWISKVYATELEKKKWVYTWNFESWIDIIWKNKVKTLKNNYDIWKYSDIIVYSDSLSDLPLFNVATEKYFVCKNNDIKAPKWFISIYK